MVAPWEYVIYVYALVATRACFCKTIEVIDGQPVILSCNQSPSANGVTWCKQQGGICNIRVAKIEGGHLTPSPPWTTEDIELFSNLSIRIKKVSLARDGGVFGCEGNGFRGSVLVKVLKISRPVRLLGPSNPVHDGANVTFSCTIHGGEQPFNMEWYMGDSKTGIYIDVGANVRSSNVSVTITKDNHGEKVVCEASVYGERVTDELVIDVGSEPTVVIQIHPRDYNLGDDVKLICDVRGRPPPTITWFARLNDSKNVTRIPFQQQVSANGVPISKDSTIRRTTWRPNIKKATKDAGIGAVRQFNTRTVIHTIHGLKPTDLGAYTCIAHNANGAGSDMVMLTLSGFDDIKMVVIFVLANSLGVFAFACGAVCIYRYLQGKRKRKNAIRCSNELTMSEETGAARPPQHIPLSDVYTYMYGDTDSRFNGNPRFQNVNDFSDDYETMKGARESDTGKCDVSRPAHTTPKLVYVRPEEDESTDMVPIK